MRATWVSTLTAAPKWSPWRWSCALEARTGKDAWRYGGRGDQWCGPVDLLQFLRANGYELADVERIVTGELDPDAAFTRLIKQDLVPSPLASIFRAAWLGLAEAVRAGLWG